MTSRPINNSGKLNRVAYRRPASVISRGYRPIDTFCLVMLILLATGAFTTLLKLVKVAQPESINPLLWLSLYTLATTRLLLQSKMGWVYWLIRYRSLLILLLLGAVLSISWSLSPQISQLRVFHLFGSTLLGIYLGFYFSPFRILKIVALVMVALFCASILIALLLPDIGLQTYNQGLAWKGAFSEKNALGLSACITILILISLIISNDIGRKSLLLVSLLPSFTALYMSQSATAMIALVCGGMASSYIWLSTRIRIPAIVTAMIAGLLLTIVALLVLSWGSPTILSAIGRSPDLTGRGEIWAQVIEMIGEYPWIGTGYGTIWMPTDDTIWVQQSLLSFTWTVHHAHNGLLHITSQLGIPLGLLALFFATQLNAESIAIQLRMQNFTPAYFLIALQIGLTAANFSEAYFLIDRNLYWILQVGVPISILLKIQAQVTGRTFTRLPNFHNPLLATTR